MNEYEVTLDVDDRIGTVLVLADDEDDAQQVAIDRVESLGQMHGTIYFIEKVD